MNAASPAARIPSSLLALLALAPLANASNVLVVGTGGYATPQAAVDAAQEGDVVLVRGGTGGALTISGKSVSVIADAGGPYVGVGRVVVQSLAAGQTVVLRGLQGTAYNQEALHVAGNTGSVRVIGSRFLCQGTLAGSGGPGARVQSSADVAFVGCEVRGGTGTPGFNQGPYPGRTGFVATGSRIALHDTRVYGSSGGGATQVTGNWTSGAPGGAGLEATGTELVIVGSRVRGGNGGGGAGVASCGGYSWPTSGGAGGDALRLSGTSTAQLLDAELVPGPGGTGGSSPCGQASSGLDGDALEGPAGAATTIAGVRRALDLQAPVHEGDPVAVAFGGVPGDEVILLLSDAPAWSFAPLLHGSLLLAAPLRRVALGIVPGSGTLDAALAVPELGPGVDARVQHAQAIGLDASGERWLSGPAVLVFLDQGI